METVTDSPQDPDPKGYFQFRAIVLGDADVGKSSLMGWAGVVVGQPLQPTIGVEFYSQTILMPSTGKAELIWDTAGQERLRSITRNFYRSAAGVLLVFDLTNRASFEHVPEWYHEAVGDRLPAFVLVGHKCDLVAEQAVAAEEAGHLAATLGMAFVETSALSNLNVELAFQPLAGGIQQALGGGILAPHQGYDSIRLIPNQSRRQPLARREPQERCQC
ncbi:LOW QUALITY PROTEIN: ras-related protein Rab-42-like [Passer montanus]|uniref:LOW QUALITY PROTEIN: ras-related protein Rab-42-like n=1 Tax=Passer montanus TaxID=9160 RepID=UPI00196005A4|nr:LOW QUALITY PROTEIN: ras-related protein Rab-42-like [Passer montanus]